MRRARMVWGRNHHALVKGGRSLRLAESVSVSAVWPVRCKPKGYHLGLQTDEAKLSKEQIFASWVSCTARVETRRAHGGVEAVEGSNVVYLEVCLYRYGVVNHFAIQHDSGCAGGTNRRVITGFY